MGWISISGIQAQTSDSLQSEPKGKINYRKYKWELTTGNILTLLRSPTSDFRTSLFIRKSVNQQVKNEYRTRKVGYRLKVDINVDQKQRKAETYDSLQNQLGHVNASDLSFQIGITSGYEWQQQWNRLQMFYGIDVSLSYAIQKKNKDTISSNPKTMEFREYITKNSITHISIGMIPFVGVKYFITPRLSVAFESRLNLSINFSKDKYEYSTYDKNYFGNSEFNTGSELSKTTSTYISFNPLGIIYISYYFN